MNSPEVHHPDALQDRPRDHTLDRVLSVLGNVAIVVSFVTPAVSLFVIAPVAFAAQGSGAFLTFVVAALIAIVVALCYAELGARLPAAGGDYSIVGRVLGRPIGFLCLVLYLVLMVFIPSALVLGAAIYLHDVIHVDPNLLGAVVIVAAAAIAILNVKTNAIITGAFLLIELAALLLVVLLAVFNANTPVHELFSPHIFSAGGGIAPASVGLITGGVAIGLFSYNGYGGAIFFSEEMDTPPRKIAHAVLWAVTVTLIAELVPLTAAMIGAPSIAKFSTAPAPMEYFIKQLAGNTVNSVVSIAIFLAVVNAAIACFVLFARILWSSARDHTWPGPVSRALVLVHPKFRSPWVATALIGLVGAALTALSTIAALVTFTGVILAVVYALIALSAIVDRLRQDRSTSRPWKMPLWPLPPLAALAGTIYVFTKQTGHDVLLTGYFLGGAALYYLLFLHRSTSWKIAVPATSETDLHAKSEIEPAGKEGGVTS